MFGKHLVERGLLSEERLLEALEQQAQMKVSFGRLAHQLGLLSLDQVVEVLREQDGSPGGRLRFGAVAVAKGFLTDEQVEVVLETQRESHMPLGQVLATLGYVDPDTLDRELTAYLGQQREEAMS